MSVKKHKDPRTGKWRIGPSPRRRAVSESRATALRKYRQYHKNRTLEEAQRRKELLISNNGRA